MYCPTKLPFFIIKCPPKLYNLPYILIYIVPLNYHFSKKCPLKLLNLVNTFICVVLLSYYFS